MAADPPIWDVTLHKEALELAVALWPNLDEEARNALAGAILAGPNWQDPMSECLVRMRDHGVLVRLGLLERTQTPLPASAATELERLRAAYPDFRLAEGDREFFTVWHESSTGHPTDYSAEDLLAMDSSVLADVLVSTSQHREGLLETWWGVARANPVVGAEVMARVATLPGGGPPDLWRRSLWALEDGIGEQRIAAPMFGALATAIEMGLEGAEFLDAAASVLEAAARRETMPIPVELFWSLWDGIFDRAAATANHEEPTDDWVNRSINRPLGKLASAAALVAFRRGLRPRAGIPVDVLPRLERFLATEPAALRLGRIMLAGRFLFLAAVDPDWAAARLAGWFDWSREEQEAAAMWQGFAWRGSIGPDSWGMIGEYFLASLTPQHLARLGAHAETIVQLFVAVAIDMPSAEIPPERIRAILEALTPELRGAAANWLSNRIYRRGLPDDADNAARDLADEQWAKRVGGWLQHNWPVASRLVGHETSQAFALICASLNVHFDAAVDQLLPLIGPVPQWGPVVRRLERSPGPDRSPARALDLVVRVVADRPLYSKPLRAVLDRMATADPPLARRTDFERLDAALRSVGLDPASA